MRAQLSALQQQLTSIQHAIAQTESTKEEEEPVAEEAAEESAEEEDPADIREGALTGLTFVQDFVLDVFPYGYDTVDAFGPLVFWLMLIPLTVIAAGFAFKAGEFGSFIMEVNTIRDPCNSTSVLSKMEEYGIRMQHCAAEAIAEGADPHVTWWDFSGAEFCLFGGKHVFDLKELLSLPTDIDSPSLDFWFEQTEDGMLGIRKTPTSKTGIVETDSFFEFLWQVVVKGKPVRLNSCGPGYVFWDMNHVLYGMVLVVLSVFVMNAFKWVETTVYPRLGLAPSSPAEEQRRGVGNRALWLLVYTVVFGYVGKALVVRDYWANDCSPFLEHRSYTLSLRWLVSFANPASYFTFTGSTVEEELGLDGVELESCDWAHLLAQSRFNPGSTNFFHLFSPAHLYYAVIGYTKYIVIRAFLTKLWFIILRPLSSVLSGRWKRARQRRTAVRRKTAQ